MSKSKLIQGPIEVPKPDQVQENKNISNSPETSISTPSCIENQTECNNGQEPGLVDCMDSKFANTSECNSSPPITPCAENGTLCNPSESPPLHAPIIRLKLDAIQ